VSKAEGSQMVTRLPKPAPEKHPKITLRHALGPPQRYTTAIAHGSTGGPRLKDKRTLGLRLPSRGPESNEEHGFRREWAVVWMHG
jgi:hypothetical protein